MWSDFPDSWPRYGLIMDSSFAVPIKQGVVEEIGSATPMGNYKEKKIKRKLSRNPKLRRMLRVLRLAMVPKGERLLQLASSLLFLRTLGKWTLLLLERRSAILPSQRLE